MADDSFITRERLEMSRAQVMQAEAAGIGPSVRMNPILLKPTNDPCLLALSPRRCGSAGLGSMANFFAVLRRKMVIFHC